MTFDRKIILEATIGSKLYGTNHEKSDDDFFGVFLHSPKDLFGMEKRQENWDCSVKLSEGPKNQFGDTDRKFISLPSFLFKSATGTADKIELLFIPKEKCKIWTPEWETVLSYRKYIVSNSLINPFIQFSKSQAFDASNKASNLTLLREFYAFFETQPVKSRLRDVMPPHLKAEVEYVLLGDSNNVEAFLLVGKTFYTSLKVSQFIIMLRDMIDLYGSRSQSAVENGGYNWKAMAHAYRLTFEAEALVTTGTLEFPLPDDQIKFLKSILRGEYRPQSGDFFDDLFKRHDHVRSLKSILPEKANYSKLEELCQELMYNQFKRNL